MPPQPQLSEEQRKQLEEKIKNMSPEELAAFQKQQCIFCQIISGKIPSKKVFEDEKTIAILDINPARKGHLLLFPKEHYAIMPQIPDKEIAHIFQVSKKLSQVLLRSLKVNGTTIFVANGLAAGQRSQHFMLHIIPRKEGDMILDDEEKVIDRKIQQKIMEVIGPKVNELLGVKKEFPHDEAAEEKSSAQLQEETEPEKGPEEEQKIALEDVPAKIITAVKKKVKGIEILEIEIEKKEGKKIYEFEGKVGEKEYEIEVEVDEKGNILDIGVEEETNDEKDENEGDNSKDQNQDKERVSLDDIANLFK